MNRLPSPHYQQPDPRESSPAYVAKLHAALDVMDEGNVLGIVLRREALGHISREAADELILAVRQQFRAMCEFASSMKSRDELRPGLN